MKNQILSILLFIVLSFTYSCQNRNLLNEKSFSISDHALKNKTNLIDYFDVIKAIRLQTNDQSLVGDISQIKKYMNGFAVSSRDNKGSLVTFNADGSFDRSWLNFGEGPGETPPNSFVTFIFTPDGKLFLPGTIKWQLFDKEGCLIKEIKKPSFIPFVFDCLYHDNSVYIIVAETNNKPILWEISLQDLSVVNRFGEEKNPLSRLKGRYNFAIFHNKNLLYISQNSLMLNNFNISKQTIQRLRPHFQNRSFQPEISPAIKQPATLRWQNIGVIDKYLYLEYIEYTANDNVDSQKFLSSHNILLNLDTNLAYEIYSYFNGTPINNFWWYPHSAWNNYLIGVCPDPVAFNKNKSSHLALKNIPFEPEDNPVLLLLKPKILP